MIPCTAKARSFWFCNIGGTGSVMSQHLMFSFPDQQMHELMHSSIPRLKTDFARAVKQAVTNPATCSPICPFFDNASDGLRLQVNVL